MKKYPNLIRELVVARSEQLWVADITYIYVGYDFNYLSLITDVYSKKIVGYHLHPNLSTEGSLQALNMALKTRTKFMPIAISKTEDGEGYENQIAERINGILKTEFYLNRIFRSHDEAKFAVAKSIEAYNTKRPHMSSDYLTPIQAHEQEGRLQKRWKNYRSKKADSSSS